MDRVRAKLIQQTEWEPCTFFGFFGEGNCPRRKLLQPCQNYVHMVEDVLKALRVFDG